MAGLSPLAERPVPQYFCGRRGVSFVLARILPVLLILNTTTCSVVTEQAQSTRAFQFLYGPETSQKLIIFVHGVLGNSLTWTNASGLSWPELIRDDPAFRDYRIATYRFDSPLLGRASTFQEISTRMLQQLEDNGVFRKYREIYFVVHSAGGVVVKRALVMLNTPAGSDKLQLVKAVLYIATPAQGADIADLGAWFSLNPQFSDLRNADFNSYMQNLEDGWADLMRQRTQPFPMAFCAYEKKPLGFKVIVTRTSAFTYCDRNAIAFDEDHISIVKPSSRDSDVYDWARARIQEASEGARAVPSTVSTQKSLEYELKRHAFLLERAKPITTATFLVQFKRPYTVTELGHYRIFLDITDPHTSNAAPPTLWFAGQSVPNQGRYALRTHVWSRNPNVMFRRRIFEADQTTELRQIKIDQDIDHTGPFQTLDSLNRKLLNIFISESLADKVEVVGFTVDGYLLLGITMKCLDQTKRNPFEAWPFPMSSAEQAVGWLHLEGRRYWPQDNSRPPFRPLLTIDYDKRIPIKSDSDGSWTVSPNCELSDIGPPPER
jgi:pimeloyl-ACP methyl ester carboxylesterase